MELAWRGKATATKAASQWKRRTDSLKMAPDFHKREPQYMCARTHKTNKQTIRIVRCLGPKLGNYKENPSLVFAHESQGIIRGRVLL